MPLMTTLTTISAQKSFGPSYIIPANSVIIFDGTYSAAIDTWDLYSNAVDKLIAGTIDQANVGVSFASSGESVSVAGTIASGGDHSGAGLFVAGGTGAFNGRSNDADAGSHNHYNTWNSDTITANSDIKPVHTKFTLLRTTANTTSFPANTVHIAATNIYTGTEQLASSSNRYIVGGTAKTNIALSAHTMMHTTNSYPIIHNHENLTVFNQVTSSFYGSLVQNGSGYQYIPEHAHTLTKTVSISNLRGKLLKLWLSAASSIPKSSVIIMYCGDLSVLPSYWKVCDGTNGTIDMQNYFLGYASSSGTSHDTLTSASTQYTLNNPNTTASDTWQHGHYLTGFGYSTQMYVKHLISNNEHAHSVSSSTLTSNYEPACIKLAFIQLIPS